MSRYDYIVSQRITYDYSFHALLMAAMRRADTANLAKLTAAFPDVWVELGRRYNAPGEAARRGGRRMRDPLPVRIIDSYTFDDLLARIAELTEAVEDARRFAAMVEGQNAAALAIVGRMHREGAHSDGCALIRTYSAGYDADCDCTANADLAAVRDALSGESA